MKNRINRKRINRAFLSILILISICLYGCTGVKESHNTPEHVFVYAENQSEDYPATKAAYQFAENVKNRTNGRIEIVVRSEGKMGDESSVVTQLGFGGVDFSRVSISSLADRIPQLNVLLMPYLFSSEEVMWKVLEGDIGAGLITAMNESGNGIRALSWFDAGTRNFYSVKPITHLSDLQGLNIRVQESEVMSDLVKVLGANPVTMSYSEVRKGLQTGKIDGAENNWSSYEYSQHYENARYCLIDEHTRIPEVQLISETAWNKLSEEDQKIIADCAYESAQYEKELWKLSENKAKADVVADGITISEISEEELTRFQNQLLPLYDKYCSDDRDVIEQIRSIR